MMKVTKNLTVFLLALSIVILSAACQSAKRPEENLTDTSSAAENTDPSSLAFAETEEEAENAEKIRETAEAEKKETEASPCEEAETTVPSGEAEDESKKEAQASSPSENPAASEKKEQETTVSEKEAASEKGTSEEARTKETSKTSRTKETEKETKETAKESAKETRTEENSAKTAKETTGETTKETASKETTAEAAKETADTHTDTECICTDSLSHDVKCKVCKTVLRSEAHTFVTVNDATHYEERCSGCGYVNKSYDYNALGMQVYNLTNTARANNGVAQLARYNSAAQAIANERAREIVTDFSHDQFADKEADIPAIAGVDSSRELAFWAYGENIAYGYRTPESVMQGWISSPGHFANIIDAEFDCLCVGVYYDPGTGYLYWVQIFGGTQYY